MARTKGDLSRALAADTKFRSIYDSHHDDITRYFIRRVDPGHVADATAEVFLVAWRNINSLPQDGEVGPWLYGVARNVLRNSRRAHVRLGRLTHRLRSTADENQHTVSPELVTVESEELMQVRTALESLRPAEREIIQLRAFEELNAVQIATVVGCSPQAARKRLARALTNLRRALEAETLMSRSRGKRKEEERGRS